MSRIESDTQLITFGSLEFLRSHLEYVSVTKHLLHSHEGSCNALNLFAQGFMSTAKFLEDEVGRVTNNRVMLMQLMQSLSAFSDLVVTECRAGLVQDCPTATQKEVCQEPTSDLRALYN